MKIGLTGSEMLIDVEIKENSVNFTVPIPEALAKLVIDTDEGPSYAPQEVLRMALNAINEAFKNHGIE